MSLKSTKPNGIVRPVLGSIALLAAGNQPFLKKALRRTNEGPHDAAPNEALRSGAADRDGDPQTASDHQHPGVAEHDPVYDAYVNMITEPKISVKASEKANVIIIGAGIAGLVAAYYIKRLQKQYPDVTFTVLEASKRTGGRIMTLSLDVAGATALGEGGAMRLPSDHLLHMALAKCTYQDLHADKSKKGATTSSQERDAFKRHYFEPFPMDNRFVYLTQLSEMDDDLKLNPLTLAELSAATAELADISLSTRGTGTNDPLVSKLRELYSNFSYGLSKNSKSASRAALRGKSIDEVKVMSLAPIDYELRILVLKAIGVKALRENGFFTQQEKNATAHLRPTRSDPKLNAAFLDDMILNDIESKKFTPQVNLAQRNFPFEKELFPHLEALLGEVSLKFSEVRCTVKEGTAPSCDTIWFDAVHTAYVDMYKHWDIPVEAFFTKCGWSLDAINLFALSHTHFRRGISFIEFWKEAFLSTKDESLAIYQYKTGFGTIVKDLEHLVCAGTTTEARNTTGGPDLKNNAVNLDARVVKIDTSAKDKVKVNYIITSSSSSSSTDLKASETVYTIEGTHVICTVPLPVLRTVTFNPPPPIDHYDAILNVNYTDVTKVLLTFTKRFWEQTDWSRYSSEQLTECQKKALAMFQRDSSSGVARGGGIITDLPMRYASLPASTAERFGGKDGAVAVMVAYNLERDAGVARSQPKEFYQRLIVDNFCTLFGKGPVLDHLVSAETIAWGADPYCGGAAFAMWNSTQRLKYFNTMRESFADGRVYLAGEHASYQHAWAEGSIESAMYVVRGIFGEGSGAAVEA